LVKSQQFLSSRSRKTLVGVLNIYKNDTKQLNETSQNSANLLRRIDVLNDENKSAVGMKTNTG